MGKWGIGGFKGSGGRVLGGLNVGTAQSPLRLMTLRDFYDCFLSYQKSYEAALCVFLLLLLLLRLGLLSFFFGKFMKFYLLPEQFAPFTFFISRHRVGSGAEKVLLPLSALLPKEFPHRMQVT